MTSRTSYALAASLIAMASLRLCFSGVLWSDEDYHLAAAINILHGRIPYRDFWYDKPPLAAGYYLLIGGFPGVLPRLLDAIYVLLSCWLAFRLATSWWGPEEGWLAALLLVFFTTFYLPAAIIPFAPDALLMAPHLAAIYFAQLGRPVWSGVFCGVGLLINMKAVFVLAVCAGWLLPAWASLLAGFAIPVLTGAVGLLACGAGPGFENQVWRWGLIYARGAPVAHPLALGLGRVADWLGFHAALGLGAIAGFFGIDQRSRRRLAVWIIFSFVAVCLGNHFAPRYFLQMLPPLVVAAARGITILRWRYRWPVLGLLLLVPFLRFGPRYAALGLDEFEQREPNWADVAMNLDSRHAAAKILALAGPGDSLFVWGYRPDIYVYTRLVPDSLFEDSQPLTGVPADRHLTVAASVDTNGASINRQRLIHSKPTFVVDGLGPLNPRLEPHVYPEIAQWLNNYRVAARTKLCVIYRRK